MQGMFSKIGGMNGQERGYDFHELVPGGGFILLSS